MRRSAVVAVVALAGLLAAGCSGDGGEGAAVSAVGGLESGVLASGVSAEALAAPLAAAGEGITVVGTGSARAVPDVAEWSFGVQTSGESAAAALDANSTAMEAVVAALREAGVAQDDLATEQVSVYPRTGPDGTAVAGYDAANSVRATIRDLGRSGAVVDAAVAAGANQVYGPTLTLSDAETQYRAAMEAAFDDARTRAEAIAEQAGLELGAPVAIVESGGGGGPVYERVADEAAAADVAVQPGTQDVAATLTVTFRAG